MRANVDRRLFGHALMMMPIFAALVALGHSPASERQDWIRMLFRAVRHAKLDFENKANDIPTLAACHELEGMATAVSALKAAFEGCDWGRHRFFESSVPAENDPIGGPRIQARAAEWAARRGAQMN